MPKGPGFIPDQTRVTFGAQADRPSFGQDGEVYIATDSYSIYLWDGDNWLNIWSGFTGLNFDLNMGGNFITDLARPQNDSEAATKKYVDDAVTGGAGDYQTFGKIDWGLAADLPAAGTDYRFYYETNSGKFKYDDGAAWHLALSLDHGDLDGLSDDDHSLYFLVDASRDLTGILERDSLETNILQALALENAAGKTYQSFLHTTRAAGDEIDLRAVYNYALLIHNVTDNADILTLDSDGILNIGSNLVAGGSLSGTTLSLSSNASISGNLDMTGNITPDGVIDGNHDTTTRLVLPVGANKFSS